MRLHPPHELRDRYRDLSENELRQLVLKTLESPSKVDDRVWKDWLVAVSFQMIRPPEKRNVARMKWRQWLAFALRYLEPLITEKDEPNTRLAVLFELNESPDLVLAQLLFGAPEQYHTLLQLAFKDSVSGTTTKLTKFRQKAVDSVRCPGYGEDVVGDWSRVPISELMSKVLEVFQPASSLATEESVQIVRSDPKRPSADYRTIFEQYVERALELPDQQFYGQALGYMNDFNRRMESANNLNRSARRATLAAVPFALIMALVWRGENIGWLMPLLVLAAVAFLFYGRLFDHLLDTFSWARAARETLETLMGNIEGDSTSD
jgi:hypothetical protein